MEENGNSKYNKATQKTSIFKLLETANKFQNIAAFNGAFFEKLTIRKRNASAIVKIDGIDGLINWGDLDIEDANEEWNSRENTAGAFIAFVAASASLLGEFSNLQDMKENR